MVVVRPYNSSETSSRARCSKGVGIYRCEVSPNSKRLGLYMNVLRMRIQVSSLLFECKSSRPWEDVAADT